MWPSTHVCYANYATIMISPESGWSISKCFERFIAGNLITETFPESNIVQIKSRVNSPLLYFELDRSFFFFFRFDEKTSRIWVEFRVYSSAIFMEWRIETKRSRRTKDNENIPGIPPISTLEHIPSRNFFQIYVPSENAFSRRMKISKVGRREIVVIKNFSSVVNSKQLTFNIFHTKVPWLANLEFHFSMC